MALVSLNSFLFLTIFCILQNFIQTSCTFNTTITTSRNSSSTEMEWYRNCEKFSAASLVPLEWRPFCAYEFKYIKGDYFTGQNALQVYCTISAGVTFSLEEFRRKVYTIEASDVECLPTTLEDFKYSFDINCVGRGNIRFPYPPRANYLWRISVRNCNIFGWFSESNKTDFQIDPVKVRVIEIADSKSFVDFKANMVYAEKIINSNIERERYCAMENLEKYVHRNVTKIPINFPDSFKKFKQSMEFMQKVAKFQQGSPGVGYVCNNLKLRYIDESWTRAIATSHVNFMVENARNPSLEVLNLSHCNMREFPTPLFEWRRHFPKMKILDLSYNRIRTFAMIKDQGLHYNDTEGVIDLRHNNITRLTERELRVFRVHSRTLKLDIRDNPFVCDCDQSPFVTFLKNQSNPVLQRYDYFLNLQCVRPENLKDRKISSLSTEELLCDSVEFVYSIGAIVTLSCVVACLIAVMIVVIKFRKEIVILAFTRLNISLPCRKVTYGEEKKFDAFIAYSSHDSGWVLQHLMPGLEQRGFQLCLHHRDFRVGAAIADNITVSVEESRHTILVISAQFLRSEWCLHEFRLALHQSLLERKKHLLMIMMENIPQNNLDADLRRCVQTLTHVKLGDRWFWDKLVFALSDGKIKAQQRDHHDDRGPHDNHVNGELPMVDNNNRLQDQPRMLNDAGINNGWDGRFHANGAVNVRNDGRDFRQDGVWVI